jgi:protein-tyrosine phosphatase
MRERADSESRAVRVEGLANCRDLGGLRRIDGTLTPRGVFYRAANIDLVTAQGWEQIRQAGIRTVVDLRQPGERDRDVSARPDWITTKASDLDGLENDAFWKDYWDNGLVGTALYYLPHLQAMPERSGAALSAIVNAPPGSVLFHCMGGRDRTGMIAMLLLAAARVQTDDVVADYLETVRLGKHRAALRGTKNTEPELDHLCRTHGTTTEGAFRAALEGIDPNATFTAAGLNARDRELLLSWRGHMTPLS